VAAVWSWGPRPAERAIRYSASASVVQTGRAEEGLADQSPANCEQLKGEILSDANLLRLLARFAPAGIPAGPGEVSGDPIERLRRDLEVTVSQSPSQDQLEITVACRGEDSTRVVGLVNQLATMVADDHRQASLAAATRAWQQAHQAAAGGHRKLLAARAALDRFLAEHFQEHQALAEKLEALARAESRQSKSPEPVATRRTIANPEWVELDRTRKELAERREELLVTRTPQHPMIRDLDAKILRLEQALASVPREIPDDADAPVIAHPLLDAPPMQPPKGATAETEPTATFGRVLPAADMVEHGPAAEKYRQLCDAADDAQKTYDRLAEAEQAAAERRLEAPEFELRLAQQCQASRPGDGSSRLLLIALVAGLALAAGAGMISTGMTADPPFRTISQAQASLPAPIIGVVPSERVSFGDSEPRPASNRTLAVWGLVVVAICLISLVVYLS
jgi:hypothetical protein